MSIVPVNRGKIEGQSHVVDVEIPKRIRKVQRAGFHGHLHVDFEDGTMRVLQKTEHEHLDLKPGDYFPPFSAPAASDPVVYRFTEGFGTLTEENKINALDATANEVSPVIGQSVDGPAEGQDEDGVASGPVDGTQEERQQGAEVESGHAPTPEIG